MSLLFSGRLIKNISANAFSPGFSVFGRFFVYGDGIPDHQGVDAKNGIHTHDGIQFEYVFIDKMVSFTVFGVFSATTVCVKIREVRVRPL